MYPGGPRPCNTGCMSAKGLMRAHEATRGIVRLHIPIVIHIIMLAIVVGGPFLIHIAKQDRPPTREGDNINQILFFACIGLDL